MSRAQAGSPLRNVDAGKRAGNVHGAVSDRRVRRVYLKGQPAADAAQIETGEAEAAAVIILDAGPEADILFLKHACSILRQ